MPVTLPKKAFSPTTKTGGTGIFVEANLKAAEECKYHMGRFVKIRLKNGVTLERQIDIPFIKSLQLGLFTILTDLR